MENASSSHEERKNRNEVFGEQKNYPQQQQNDFGFEIPNETVPLPSRGFVYPPSSPLHLKDRIDIRSMTVRDEDILNSRAFAKKGITITKLLESCITEKGVNVRDMIAADRNALLVSLRIISYGADYTGEIECDECGFKNSEYQFDLSRLPVKYLEVEPVEKGTNKFEVILPVWKQPAVVKFLTGREEEEILTMLERSNKAKIPDNSLVSTRLKYSLVSIGNETDKGKLSSIINRMPALDSKTIHEFFNKNEPGIDMKVDFECSDCGTEKRVALPVGAQFFRPY